MRWWYCWSSFWLKHPMQKNKRSFSTARSLIGSALFLGIFFPGCCQLPLLKSYKFKRSNRFEWARCHLRKRTKLLCVWEGGFFSRPLPSGALGKRLARSAVSISIPEPRDPKLKLQHQSHVLTLQRRLDIDQNVYSQFLITLNTYLSS